MDIDRIERTVVAAARLYRELNKPILRSRIDMTHEIYADDEADEPMMSVDVKGSPRVKLLDLLLVGGALMIFLSAVSSICRCFRRR